MLLAPLVRYRPSYAFHMGAKTLDVVSVRMRLPASSPLHSENGGQLIEFPLDDVVAPQILKSGSWEVADLDFLAPYLPDARTILVDVGANIGLYARQIRHRFPQIDTAICFEPQPTYFEYLTRNLAHLSGCHLIQAALGDVDGEIAFYEHPENIGSGSILSSRKDDAVLVRSTVPCMQASDENVLGPVEDRPDDPIVWKSDTEGLDEAIMCSLSDRFWSRVQAGKAELWPPAGRPELDRRRFRQILEGFPIRRFRHDLERNLTVTRFSTPSKRRRVSAICCLRARRSAKRSAYLAARVTGASSSARGEPGAPLQRQVGLPDREPVHPE